MTSTADYAQLRAQLETLTTEAFRPELAEIDRRSTLDIARTMNGEDATVPAAVAERLPGDRRRHRRHRRAHGPRRPADLRGRRHRRPARRAGRQRVPADLQHRPVRGASA